jgi:hypothetical protein
MESRDQLKQIRLKRYTQIHSTSKTCRSVVSKFARRAQTRIRTDPAIKTALTPRATCGNHIANIRNNTTSIVYPTKNSHLGPCNWRNCSLHLPKKESPIPTVKTLAQRKQRDCKVWQSTSRTALDARKRFSTSSFVVDNCLLRPVIGLPRLRKS